jgi:hypothetical protein
MGLVSNDIYAGISFLGSAVSITRITPSKTDTQGRYFQPYISWIKNIGTDSVSSQQTFPSMCVDSTEQTVFVGSSIIYNDGFTSSTVAGLLTFAASSGSLYQFKKNLDMENVSQMQCLAER